MPPRKKYSLEPTIIDNDSEEPMLLDDDLSSDFVPSAKAFFEPRMRGTPVRQLEGKIATVLVMYLEILKGAIGAITLWKKGAYLKK